jgi:hypothetical protein
MTKEKKGQKKAKTPKPPQKNVENMTPPSLNMGEQFKRGQLALLARSLQNIDFTFDVTTKAGLISLQADLLHLQLQRKLSGPDASAASHGVRNLVQLVEVSAARLVVDEEEVIARFVNSLPAALRNGIVAYGRTQTHLEQALTQA